MNLVRPVVVIPVYNHDRYLSALVGAIVRMRVPCILVDDASAEPCSALIDQLAALHSGQVLVVRHLENQGKGGAVVSGFERAHDLQYTHALQIDADGQHAVEDIPVMLELARAHPTALIAGQPIFDESVPRTRLYFRYLTHYMVSINTLHFKLRDAMCGFRVYPLAATLALNERTPLGRHMDFDIDVMVRLDWAGVPIVLRRTKVRYPADGVSHFRLLTDNVHITWMHTRLFFGMLRRLPRLALRRRADPETDA